MRFQSLKHLVTVARAAAQSERIIVLGSSSLLASFPHLGEKGELIDTSFDADLLIEPVDEDLALMLGEAIGQDRKFHARYGYHADILRPEIIELLPKEWEERLVPLPECGGVFCLEPHDLAVAKLQAGRPKDIDLLTALLKRGMLDEETVRARLSKTRLREQMIVLTHRRLDEAVARAGLN